MEMSAEWKLEKLKQCIEASMIESDGKVQLVNHKALLGAISESNKMQGHYAAEKKQISVSEEKEDRDFKELVKSQMKEF